MDFFVEETYTYPFKLVILGDTGTGKTTFLNRHLDCVKHEPIPGLAIYKKDIHSTFGDEIQLYCWDAIGEEGFNFLQDNYIIGARCAIIMFDVTCRKSYKNVPKWHRMLRRLCGGIPIVLCGNKVDVNNRQIKAKRVTFHRKNNLHYCEISAKANYNLNKPFQYLARDMLEHIHPDPSFRALVSVDFGNKLSLAPPEVGMDMASQKRASVSASESSGSGPAFRTHDTQDEHLSRVLNPVPLPQLMHLIFGIWRKKNNRYQRIWKVTLRLVWYKIVKKIEEKNVEDV